MKKLIVAILAAGMLAAVPITAFAGQTIDATHLNLSGNGCTQCHFSMDTTTGLEIVPGNTCSNCHNNETSGYSDVSAPYVTTHKGFACQTCHNPHVSLEYSNVSGAGADPLVAGSVSAFDYLTTPGEITFNVGALTFTNMWGSNSTDWYTKTKTGRGLIFWLSQSNGKTDDLLTTNHNEALDNYSFEVIGAAADQTTVTVADPDNIGATLGAVSSFELHYGQLIARAVDPATSTYRDANATTAAVDFPATHNVGTIDGNFFVTATGDGICQKCHTLTAHWQNTPDTARDNHPASNPGELCTDCHKHENKTGPAYGFGPDTANCATCHSTYPEPPASGAHSTHASPTTGYAFSCVMCHKGGMNKQMGYIPFDGNVQIGFNLIPNGTLNYSGANTSYDGVAGTFADPDGYGSGYQGKNDTVVTTNGSMTCSNIYCHSGGYASRLGCTTSPLSTSPKWDGTSPDPQGDTNKCNNCHDNANVPAGFTLGNTSTPGYNAHWPHINVFIPCSNCHNATITATDNKTIANKSLHVNGSVDLAPGGDYYGTPVTFTYDPVTRTCSGIACHVPRTWIDKNSNTAGTGDDVSCEVVAATPNVDPVQSATCYNSASNSFVMVDSSRDDDYIDPVKEAAFGGHSGGVTWFKVNWYNNGGNIFDSATVTYAPKAQDISGYSFDDTFMATNNNQIWMIYTIFDNDANSFTNEANAVSGGWIKSAWFMCDYGAFAGSTNDLPIMKFVSSSVNPTTLRITDQSYDKDWNTTPSNTLWTGTDKNAVNGCGNDGSNAYYKFLWYDTAASGTLTTMSVNLTDTPKDTVVEHTYDPSYLAGGKAWFSYSIKDNSYLQCGTGFWVKSGWRQQLLQ